MLRSILKSRAPADIAKAAAYGKRMRLYPLAAAAQPPQTVFVDALQTVVSCVIPYDLRFFQALDRFVQAEPWLERDRAMIDSLKSPGIQKGKPFKPDAATVALLESAAQEALALFDQRYETIYAPHNEGMHWFLPADAELLASVGSGYTQADSYPTPPKPPVHQYWSTGLYDFATHALIRNVPLASRSSQSPGLMTNADGSVDLYFASKAPAGKEANWIPTDAKGRFEAVFRFYGPDEALFKKTWVLPDIERMA